tara:strand:- start:1533 stop:2135 length:603 start_codon:yes stop_codon:yes gene_type:complete
MTLDGRKLRAAQTYSAMHSKILVAARELLQATEFIDLTIPMIAQHAKCSVPTIYNHFPEGLQDIYKEVTFFTIDEAFNTRSLDPGERGRLSSRDYVNSLLEGLAETILNNKNVATAITAYAPQAAASGKWDADTLKELRSPVSIALEDLELQIFTEEIFYTLELILRGAVSSWVLGYLTDKEFFEHMSGSFNRAEKIVTT